jgi:predicted extracellular nuclease
MMFIGSAPDSATKKTPLSAAFFVSSLVFLIAGCQESSPIPQLSSDACSLNATPINSIQGNGELSPLLGQELTAKGIVTHESPDHGVYIEQADADDSDLTSNGLFLNSPDIDSAVAVGDEVVIQGLVSEIGDANNTITSLSELTGFRVCSSHQRLPSTRTRLPLTGKQKESLEGMNITIETELVVTDNYRSLNGQFTLSLDGILPNPTEVARPGRDARAQSAKNRQASINIQRLDSDSEAIPVGARIMGIAGVLGHDGRVLRLQNNEKLRHNIPPIYAVPAPGENEIRVVGLNLLNYFNGDGKGGGFPTPRGAWKTMGTVNSARRRILLRPLKMPWTRPGK